MGWQWHQLDHMQIICTSLQTDNHASTSLALCCLYARMTGVHYFVPGRGIRSILQPASLCISRLAGISSKSSAVAEMGDRGHDRHGPKKGSCCAPFAVSRGELGPFLTQCGLGRSLLPYQVASSSIQPFGHNRHEPKTGGCAPFRGSCDQI